MFLRQVFNLIICSIFAVLVATVSAEKIDPNSENGFELDEIIVTGTRTEHWLKDVPVIVEVISRSEIETSGAGNIGEVLENYTGLIIQRDALSEGVQMQGLSSKYSLILIDGQPQIGRIAGKLNLARLPIENVERIEIVKGASSALFGSEAMGGVINIITRNAKKPLSVQFASNLGENNKIDNRGTFEMKRDHVNLAMTLSINRSDALDLDKSDLTTTIDGYENFAISSRLTYDLSKNTKLFFSTQRLDRDQNSVSENRGVVFDRDRRTDNFSVGAGIDRKFGDRSKLKIGGYGTTYRYISILSDRTENMPRSENLDAQKFVKSDLQFDTSIGKRNKLVIGGELIFEKMESGRIESGEKETSTAAIFLQDEIKIAKAIVLVLGGRIDFHSEFGKHFSPKISSAFEISEDLKLRASFGRGFRSPDFKDLYLDFTNYEIGYNIIGNPDLKPETSNSWNLGIEYKLRNAILGRIHFYRNDLTNLIDGRRIGKTAVSNKYQYQNVLEAFTEGVEINVSTRSIRGFSGAIGYSFLIAEDRETEMPLLNRSRHTGTLKLSYGNIVHGLKIDLRGRYAGRWGIYDDGDHVLEGNEFAPGFTLWDLRISKTILDGIKFSVRTENLTNFKKPQFYTFAGRSFYGGLSFDFSKIARSSAKSKR